MEETAIKLLKSLLEQENLLLKRMVNGKFVSSEDLENLKRIHKQKEELLPQILKLENDKLLKNRKEIEELNLINLENKRLLINLIEIYRYY